MQVLSTLRGRRLHLYDKALQFANDEIKKVIYSNDRSKRFILLKSEKGFYKYIYEEI